MSDTQEQLQHHWALDSLAAEAVAQQVDETKQASELERALAPLSDQAIKLRDDNREEIGKIFTGESPKLLYVFGPCSLDTGVDYTPLFDYIEQLQGGHPDAVFAFRANGAKPRTGKGWTGLFYGNDEAVVTLFDVATEATQRGIPVFTEVTEGEQLGALAPYLSGAWVGARDVESTALRGKFSAFHLPVGIKNGRTGEVAVVNKAIETIKASSRDNDESRVLLGQIAMRPGFAGIATLPVTVGEGNSQLAIIARGHEVSPDMSKAAKYELAIKHLSDICLLGATEGSAVILDGTHGVPPMFEIDKKESKRFLSVLKLVHKAIVKGYIGNADQIRGVMGEVGTEQGRTDPNLILNVRTNKQLAKLVETTSKLLRNDT